MMQDSIVRIKGSDGCINCQLNIEDPGSGLWIIRCEWSTVEAMRASVEAILKPVFDNLILNCELLSIKVSDDVCQVQNQTAR